MVGQHDMEDPLMVWLRQGPVGLCEHTQRLEPVGAGEVMGGGGTDGGGALYMIRFCTIALFTYKSF